MPGDDYQHVTSGDPLKIPAKAWNDVLDSLVAAGLLQRGGKPSRTRQRHIISVENDTGADLGQFQIVGIGAPITVPNSNTDEDPYGDQEAEFRTQVVFSGATPTLANHFGLFAVVLDGIPSGDIGAALFAGVIQCKLDVKDENHAYADVADGDVTVLRTNSSGMAQILWQESGTGEKWGVVRLGFRSPASMMAKVVSFTEGSGIYGGEYTVKVIDMSGNEYETVEHVPNIREDSNVNNLFAVDEPVTVFDDNFGNWYIDSGREVLR